MKQLRIIVVLLFVITLLFSRIEYLSLVVEEPFMLTGSDRFFLIISLSLIVLFPFWGRLSLLWPLAIWLMPLLLLTLPHIWQLPLNVTAIQIHVAEAAVMALLVFLAHRLSQLLGEFEESVVDIALDAKALQSLPLDRDTANDQIRLEFTRAREGHRPLSLLIFEPNETDRQVTFSKMLEEIQQAIVHRYTFLRMAKVIRQRLRATDLILQEQLNKRIVLLCPEVTPDQSATLLQQINQALYQQLGMRAKWASATFPEEGFTYDGLMASAERKLNPSTAIPAASATSTHDNGHGHAKRISSGYVNSPSPHSSADVGVLEER